MKLPYGNSNFEAIRKEGYFYVDKTSYHERLEMRPEKSVMLLRSRRFGKSLFCSMLGCYYDRLYADRFEKLFAGTYIGAHPTPKRNSYMMLNFNFSGINTEILENAHDGFTRSVRSSVELFLRRYQEFFPADDFREIVESPRPNDILNTLFRKISGRNLGQCVYVIITERTQESRGGTAGAIYKAIAPVSSLICNPTSWSSGKTAASNAFSFPE